MSKTYTYAWSDPRATYRADMETASPDHIVRMILTGEVAAENLIRVVEHVIRFDMIQASAGRISEMVSVVSPDDNIYRVSIFPDGIDILCFGLSSVDSDINGHYDRSDDLPEWVKERLAVLMITSSTPPTNDVAGVGRRISSHVYWVYAPERT